MVNLSLSTAVGAIVHDARSSHANNNSSINTINDNDNSNNHNKKNVVLAIDEIQHGLFQSDDETADDLRGNHPLRFLLRHLIGDLMMELMARCEPFFVVPMIAGLRLSQYQALDAHEDSSIQISNLVPASFSIKKPCGK